MLDKVVKYILIIVALVFFGYAIYSYLSKSPNDNELKLKKSLDSANTIIKLKQNQIKLDSGLRAKNDKKKEELISKLKQDRIKDSLLHTYQRTINKEVDKKYQNASLNKLKLTLDSLYVLDSLNTDF